MLGDNQADPTLDRAVKHLQDINASRKALNGEAGEVYQELRDAGYNVKAVRRLVTELAMDQDALAAFNDTLEDYRARLGQLADTPLGQAAEPARPMPAKTFAEQPVHTPRPRGRPRKDAAEAPSSGNGSRPMFDA